MKLPGIWPLTFTGKCPRPPHFRPPPAGIEVREDLLSSVMQTYPEYVTKNLICPSCGSKEQIRFEQFEMMFDAPCLSCGIMIRWKRKPQGSGGGIRIAMDDYEPEIAPLDLGK